MKHIYEFMCILFVLSGHKLLCTDRVFFFNSLQEIENNLRLTVFGKEQNMVMETPTAQCVGGEFVRQYYTLLNNKTPLHLLRNGSEYSSDTVVRKFGILQPPCETTVGPQHELGADSCKSYWEADDEKEVKEKLEVKAKAGKYDQEALTAVKMAIKLKQRGHFEKARKLFQHAMALNPNHFDVLLHYGEFLELNKDFIKAEHFYLKTLIISPKNSRGLANRRRTLPLVNQMDLEELMRISMKKDVLVRKNKKDPALEILKKELDIQGIHHSVAIEGNTLSLSEIRSVLETGIAVPGKSISLCDEILGVQAALHYVNQTLVSKNNVTVTDVLEIHRNVMGDVDPLIAGTFRKSQVYVGEHIAPAASDVESLMEEFLEQLQSAVMTETHPVHVAAFAHHRLVFIHPFKDGNGRTSRLLMNLMFLRLGYPPIIIRKECQSEYYNYLQISHEGDVRPFYRFIARGTEYTLDAYLHAHELQQTRLKALESNNDIKDKIPC